MLSNQILNFLYEYAPIYLQKFLFCLLCKDGVVFFDTTKVFSILSYKLLNGKKMQ